MQDRVPWLDYLSNHVGLKEVPGAQHNPLIVEWGKQSGIDWWNNDEDAWCAVAVNGALVNSGYPSTRSALARSFTRYGTRLSSPVRGAIVVFPRGSNPLYGHVGIVESVRADGTIVIINGNSGNAVRRSVFRTSSILPDGIRWPPGAVAPSESGPVAVDVPLGARVLQFGSRGEDVEALQRDMNVLNYQLTVDGVFGGRTRDAVMRFEQRRGLKGDGIADPAMLAALTAAVDARTKQDDRRKTAEKAAAPIAGAGAAVTVGAAATSTVDMASDVSAVDGGTMIGMAAIAVAVALVAAILLWRYSIRRAEGPILDEAV
ncbi:TIGR02594 family protein [Acuticoccus sp. I52.16.1]|uniref:C40 family peptidase n=1 Tax=Acuticoccus sp. I52.16.1 TaxID=2928472 RepID=UPI001FD02955|nr:TIGR02594 family protein [Acuticoccus sp. I52.16.1]UOM33840.1 TIGR02594 family protein [Acuticoccus sp. I52.16.1]